MNQKTKNTDISTAICKLCNDVGFIFYEKDGYSYSEKCKCRIAKEYQEMLQRSGLSVFLKSRDFDSFKAKTEEQRTVKQQCRDCVVQNKSAVISGQVGSGKTHLAIAMLLEHSKQGKYIKYVNYLELVRNLSQNAMDKEYYYRIIGQYKNIPVLLIDDLFKGAVSEAQKRYIYEIVDYRYNMQKITITTTEKSIDELFDVDEAIASRLVQMAGGFVISMKGIKNQRL